MTIPGSGSMAPQPHRRRVSSILTVALATVAFLVIVGLASAGLKYGLQGHVADSLRARATLRISGSALGELIVLMILVVFLHRGGHSLHELGLRPSPLRGWVVSALATAFYVWMTFSAVLRGNAMFSEPGAFHIYNSLAAGISAGFVEEVFFRGFVMSELKWSGFGSAVQATVSAVLFGVAHVGWGFLSGKVSWAVLLGSLVPATVLGLLFAIAYLLGRRSLLPVIAGHCVIDLLIEPWLVLTALGAAMPHP